MAMSKNPKDRDFSDASEVDSNVEEKKVDENADGHKEEIPDSIWDDNRRLIAKAQKLIDEGRAACKREISILQRMIDKKKSKEELEEDKKRLGRN